MTHGTSFAELFSGTPFGDSFSLSIILLQIGFYLFYSYVQYILSKKLEVKYSWMAWVPVLSLFNLVKIAGKSYWWVLWIILGFMAFIIPGLILSIMVLHAISKRTGHSGWWTVGLVFAKWLFLPVTAFHYQKGDEITPRPFTGWKKVLLILCVLGLPFGILGIIAATIYPAMNGYLERSHYDAVRTSYIKGDLARIGYIKNIGMMIDVYYSDYEKYPDNTPSGCFSKTTLPSTYIYTSTGLTDPLPSNIMPGCDGTDGTFAYRLIKGDDGREVYVIGAKMEDTKNGNSNLPIDQITADMVLVQGSGIYYYHVGE